VNRPAAGIWTGLPLGRDVRLLTSDANGVAAFAKPAGVLSHPNAPRGEPRALLTCAYEPAAECYVWREATGGERRLWLLNRLDSATSGVILVAATGAVAAAIKAQFARKQVRKVYQALVFGRPAAAAQTWRDHLAVERRDGAIRVSVGGPLPAEARCAVLRRGAGEPPRALVQLEPRTGRSHQLRVQCAHHGLPIVGDQTYGDFRANRELARRTGSKRLFLHSLETRFSYELGGRTHHFEATAPLPAEFDRVLG
jgi:23S rRNA-/tRNA-specific pseudouridylate synthase